MPIKASAVHQNFISSVTDTVNSAFNDWYTLAKRNSKQTVPPNAMTGFVHPHKKQMIGSTTEHSAMNTSA